MRARRGDCGVGFVVAVGAARRRQSRSGCGSARCLPPDPLTTVMPSNHSELADCGFQFVLPPATLELARGHIAR